MSLDNSVTYVFRLYQATSNETVEKLNININIIHLY